MFLICFKVDVALRCINEEFVGSIKEAMFHEMQLRSLVKDGSIDLNAS